MGILGNFQIERRIVDKNQCIRTEQADSFLRPFHVAQNFRQMAEHFREGHKCHVLIVDNGGNARSLLHIVASKIGKFRIRVLLAQRPDKSSCMDVAGCLAGNEEIFHKRKFKLVYPTKVNKLCRIT